jgi:thiol-disulfide isomerase/thioredoxin
MAPNRIHGTTNSLTVDQDDKEETMISHSLTGLLGKDWRISMFGPSIRLNNVYQNGQDEESIPSLVRTEDAFDTDKFDYIAVFIGANYCPHCKEFAPYVVKSAPLLEKKRRCKMSRTLRRAVRRMRAWTSCLLILTRPRYSEIFSS